MRLCRIKNKIIGLNQPKVCVPLVGVNDEEILAHADRVLEESGGDGKVDMVELRGDYYESLNDKDCLTKLLGTLLDKLGDVILLFTVRSESEGGEALSFCSPSIAEINAYVIRNKLADMVDVELFSGTDSVKELIMLAKENDVKIILSNHDFNTTPDAEVIVNRLRSMQDLGADIAKIAVMPENKMHVLNLLAATSIMSDGYAEIPIVTISMGRLGAITRMCGELFGSSITFAAMGKTSAPGQIPVGELNYFLNMIGKLCN